MNPLILTLRLDQQSSQFFDRERERFFPSKRNFLSAHVTMFHHLPPDEEGSIRSILADATLDQTSFPVAVEGLRFLGRGVAYQLAATELTTLRADLAARWDAWLTSQDRQKFHPHVTVQNKVEPAQARALFGQLRAGFAPWEAQGVGLDLWEYQGGPWGFVEGFAFRL